jgi:hypothetical protein
MTLKRSLRLNSAFKDYYFTHLSHRQIVSCRRPAVTFATLASPLSSFPYPTVASPANFDKIHSRTRQLAGHLQQSRPTAAMASLPISDKGYHSKAPSTYTARKIGSPYTLEHRIFIEKDGVPVSPFHDIPLYANEQQTILNMIVEVPRWTNAKMEVCTLQKPVSEEIGLFFSFYSQLTQSISTDLQRGNSQPYQAGHQEGQAPICEELLPAQGLPLELRCLPPGTQIP